MVINRKAVGDRSREKLKSEIKNEVTNMFESALDYAQVAVPPQNWQQLRSKILRVGNNCIRNLYTKLKYYDIDYKSTSEDVIEFKRP